MIVLTVSERIKPTPVVPFVQNTNQHLPQTHAATVYQEVMRRDKLIKELVNAFKHKVGDEIEPAKQEDFDKYGKCTIMGICAAYIHLEKDFKWPKNDNPMIVTASSENGEIFYATTNYFKQ